MYHVESIGLYAIVIIMVFIMLMVSASFVWLNGTKKQITIYGFILLIIGSLIIGYILVK